VVGVQLRKAVKNGAKLISVNPREHNLSLISDIWLRPLPGEEIEILRRLAALIKSDNATPVPSRGNRIAIKEGDDIAHAAGLLGESGNSCIIIGAEFLKYNEFEQILIEVEKIAETVNAGLLLLPSQNNLYGSFLMGACAELLPGGISITRKNVLNKFKEVWGNRASNGFFTRSSIPYSFTKKPKVLYLVGELPPDYIGDAEYVISQNIYPPEPTDKIDLVLPAVPFTEADGTSVNRDGQIRFFRKAVEPPGDASPDWQILCQIARKMGKEGFAFSKIEEIHAEISAFITAFENPDAMLSGRIPLTIDPGLLSSPTRPPTGKKGNKKYPYLLTTSADDNIYRGYSLNKYVAGLRSLYQVDIVDINPEDARNLGIAQGDEVVVSSADFDKTWRAALKPGQLPGTAHVILARTESIGANPHFVKIRKKDV
jgi:predicted molibdopterin-dependent oxidoreductase YjgC